MPITPKPEVSTAFGPLKGERLELAPSTLTEWPKRGVANDTLAREPIAIVVRPGDEEPWAVFSPQLDDRVARLDLTRDHLMDRRSGERWDPERGLKTEDPSNPEILVQLMATWFPQ